MLDYTTLLSYTQGSEARLLMPRLTSPMASAGR